MRMTWPSRAVVLLLVLCCCRAQDSLQCHHQGPTERCFFDKFDHGSGRRVGDWCSWTTDGKWGLYKELHAYSEYYPRLHDSKTSAVLTSRAACSTQGQTHCLSFNYRFTANNSIDLNVFIRNFETNERRKVWSLSSPEKLNTWNLDATVPITTRFSFVVEFEAVRSSGCPNDAWVAIDYIRYRGPVQPPNAAVPTTTSATRSTSKTTTDSKWSSSVVNRGNWCSGGGPERCHFAEPAGSGDWVGDWCGWTTDGGWGLYKTSSVDFEPRLHGNKTSGLLTSTTACSTEGKTLGLKFLYSFSGHSIDLNVYVRNVENGDRKRLWSLSSESWPGWKAYVPITTDFSYTVEFEAVRRYRNSSDASLRIDDIEYDRICTVQPPDAAVPTPAPPATTSPPVIIIVVTSIASLITVTVVTIIAITVCAKSEACKSSCRKDVKRVDREGHEEDTELGEYTYIDENFLSPNRPGVTSSSQSRGDYEDPNYLHPILNPGEEEQGEDPNYLHPINNPGEEKQEKVNKYLELIPDPAEIRDEALPEMAHRSRRAAMTDTIYIDAASRDPADNSLNTALPPLELQNPEEDDSLNTTLPPLERQNQEGDPIICAAHQGASHVHRNAGRLELGDSSDNYTHMYSPLGARSPDHPYAALPRSQTAARCYDYVNVEGGRRDQRPGEEGEDPN